MMDKDHTIVLDNPMELEPIFGTPYPSPLQESSKGREKRAMGDAVGIVHYGVNLVHIPPGEISSQRHWHSKQDEFLYMLEGELTLITDGGERVLKAGMAAGFLANSGDGHHLRNDSASVASYLVVGDRVGGDVCHYSDVDLHGVVSSDGQSITFSHKEGHSYEEKD